MVGPELASNGDEDGWSSAQPRPTAAACSPNRRGQAVLAAVQRGRNVAVVPPMRPVSPAPTLRSWAFNAEVMIPPGMDPVAPQGCGPACLGRRGRGQDLAYVPCDDLPLRRPHTRSVAERWASTEDLDRDCETMPLL